MLQSPGAAAAPLSANAAVPLLSRSNPAILTIAHRGVWTEAPENSLAAIRAAIALGAEIVEIDAQATVDRALVVMHDDSIDRTSTGTGVVAGLTLAQIQDARLRAGGGGGTPVTWEVVPTLAEALEEARGRIVVNVDVKFAHDFDAVAALVVALGMQDQVVLKTAVDPDAEDFAIAGKPWFGRVVHMPMLAARPGRFAADLRRLEALAPPMLEVWFERLEDLIEGGDELARQDIRLWINTLDVAHCLDFNDSRALGDPDAVWGVLVDAGVGAIQTDAVAQFKGWLAGRPA